MQRLKATSKKGVTRIISGGQTGVDRAALDFALSRNIPHGGYCPKGRLAEDGMIPERYSLDEIATEDYSVRTEKNVDLSDGTLILSRGTTQGGTLFTETYALFVMKPMLVVDIETPFSLVTIRNWIMENQIRILNIAGPRESEFPGIYRNTLNLLEQLFG